MRKISLCIQAALYIMAGLIHFITPEVYMPIMPPAIPVNWHFFLVILSGIFELVLGMGLLFHITRKWAAVGIILLLVAVFPANIYMAIEHEKLEVNVWLAYGRLPIQLLLMLWAWTFVRKPALKSK